VKKWMLTLLCLILCLSCIALAEGETPEREERTSGDYTYILMDDDAAFDDCPNFTLTVGRDSYAKEYCVANGLKYTYPDANDWLNG